MTSGHLRQHFLKTRAVKICSRIAVIYEENRIQKTIFSGVLKQNGLLRLDLSRINSPGCDIPYHILFLLAL
jgi:hypothetical protein